MKTSKNLLLLILFFAVLVSCSKEFDWWSKGPKESFVAPISQLQGPEEIFANQQATFTVSYTKPQPCYTRTGIHTKIQGFEMSVEVHIVRDHVYACPDMLVGETAEFSVVFPIAGTYYLHYRGPEGPDAMEIEVN
ncbi:MAG: hypothetical protein K0B09_09675 [Bacteroidales bacterium]|nr:hypothetical protein [Bacteroidales bacterium]